MNIVFFTGAGISVASGLATYRGEGGIYTNNVVKPLTIDSSTTRESFKYDIAKMERALISFAATPNKAHQLIADLEENHNVVVITQNVDNLHSVSSNVVELHGNLFRTRYDDRFGLLRPDVVFFGEDLPEGVFEQAWEAVFSADMFVSVGTSGSVFPAATLMELAFEQAWLNPSRYKAYHIDPLEPEIGLSAAYHIAQDAISGLEYLIEKESL